MPGLAAGAAVGGLGLVALTSGGVAEALWSPSDRVRSVIQHVAAGTVFAGLTAEVLTELLTRPQPLAWAAVGMALGLSG